MAISLSDCSVAPKLTVGTRLGVPKLESRELGCECELCDPRGELGSVSVSVPNPVLPSVVLVDCCFGRGSGSMVPWGGGSISRKLRMMWRTVPRCCGGIFRITLCS